MENEDMELLMEGLEEVFKKYGNMTAPQACEKSGMNGIIESLEVAQAIALLEVEKRIVVIGSETYNKPDGSIGTVRVFGLCN